MCYMTGKFKGFRSKSSQSRHIRKISVAPYRNVNHYEVLRGKFTQRQPEVTDLQSAGNQAGVWNLSIPPVTLERSLPS